MHIIFNSHWLHTRHDAVGRPCARDRMRVRLCLESSGGWSVSERTSILNGKYFSSRSLNWIVTLRENSATNMDVCWRCHAASITNSDIFMCVNFQCGARTIWLRARQLPLHATQKIYKKAKEGIDTKNRTKIPIHIIDNNLFHHQCITISTDFFQLKLYARREEERSHFVVIACDRIRLDCIGDNVSHTQRVVSPSIVHILDHFVHFTLFYGVCSMFISMFVCLCVCVKYSGTFLRCGCEFTSFIFQSHFELFTIVCWRLKCCRRRTHRSYTSQTNRTDDYNFIQNIPWWNYSNGFKRCITSVFCLFAVVLLTLLLWRWWCCYILALFVPVRNGWESFISVYEPICRRVWFNFYYYYDSTVGFNAFQPMDSQQILSLVWRSIVWSPRNRSSSSRIPQWFHVSYRRHKHIRSRIVRIWWQKMHSIHLSRFIRLNLKYTQPRYTFLWHTKKLRLEIISSRDWRPVKPNAVHKFSQMWQNMFVCRQEVDKLKTHNFLLLFSHLHHNIRIYGFLSPLLTRSNDQ